MLLRPFPHPRKANVALTVLATLLLLFGLTLVDAAWRSQRTDDAASRALVRELGLTDLSLFTAARYTRHPAQATAARLTTLFSPSQSCPFSTRTG